MERSESRDRFSRYKVGLGRNPWPRSLKLVKIFGHLAEGSQHGRVAEIPQVRIARPLERQRAGMFRLARHGFGSPDGRRLVRALLRLAGGDAFIGPDERQRDVI